MSTVIICGAGVDKSDGINMPLGVELVPHIRDFLKTDDGQAIDKALRDVLPNLRFSYDKFVKSAVDKLSNEFRSQVTVIVERINIQIEKDDTNEQDRRMGKLIVALLTKIQRLQDDVRLDEKTAELITEVFQGDVSIEDENIIDLPKLSFTDVFNTVMRRIFERSLDEPHHPILQHVRGNLMDFEKLLMDNFIGFYTESESQMKNYMYLSWTLWAYLKYRESKVNGGADKIPFYGAVPADWRMITLNYTAFARKRTATEPALYFHGDLSSFVRMRDRQQMSIDGYGNLNMLGFIKDIIGANTSFDKGKRATCVVPSIIPPLKMKPVLSNTFIETWFRCKEAISEARRIVIVGYSFNYADEHFNDLIRCHKNKPIVVVDPYAEAVRENLMNIFSHRPDDYVCSKVQGKDCFAKDDLRIIKAKATELDWAQFDDTRA